MFASPYKYVIFEALLIDLYRAFDYIPHDLIIAKLGAYGFHVEALKLIRDCFSNRKQSVRINDVYSSWKDIFYDVQQGSIFGPLLFNILLCDLFYFLEGLDVVSSADYTTIYAVNGTKKESAISAIETSSSLLFGLFNNNFMKANSGKSHLITYIRV